MEINIYNLAGKKVYSTTGRGSQKNININNFPTGMYIISLLEKGKTEPIKMKYIKL